MGIRRDLDATGIRGYQIPVTGVIGLVVRSHVTDGPGGTAGRTVNIHLDAEALASLVATIAELNPDMILRVAAAITEADTIADTTARRGQYERRGPQHSGGMIPYGRIRLLTAAAHGHRATEKQS
jgi:hypothetical protein